jgi:Signal transduction histidine kinase
MERKRERKKEIKLCVVIELVAIVLVSTVLLGMYHFTKESVQTVNEAKTQWFLAQCAAPRYSAYGETIDPSHADFFLDVMSDLVFDLGKEPGYEGNYVFANYFRDRKNNAGMVMEGHIAFAVLDTKDGRRIWNLGKYFPEKELREFIETTDQARNKRGIWAYPTIEKLWGRREANGEITLTMIMIYVPANFGDTEIKAVGYADTDELIWDKSRDMWDTDTMRYDEVSDRNPDSEARLYMFAQNDSFAREVRLNGTDAYRTDDRYTVAELAYSEEGAGLIEFTDSRIREIRDIAGKEIFLRDGEELGCDGEVILAFDNKAITLSRLKRPLIVICAIGQALAFISAILLIGSLRRGNQLRNLRNMFINAMAHELKTPVAVMRNTAEYLSCGARPEKQGHYLEVLKRESESVNDKLNRMLTYTRLMNESVTLHPEETDWNLLTETALESYSDLIAEKGMTVDFTVRTSEKPSCDPTLMSMVIDNLVSNAVRHGEPGSTIVIQTVDKRFNIWNKADPLTEKELRELWTPMYQTDRKSADSQTGGMGLAISAGILERHGAMYGAYNKDDGLLFRFDFSKSAQVAKTQKYAWVSMLAMVLSLTAALMYGMNYISRGQTMELCVVLVWLLNGVIQSLNYTRATLGWQSRRIKKLKA